MKWAHTHLDEWFQPHFTDGRDYPDCPKARPCWQQVHDNFELEVNDERDPDDPR